MRSLTKFVEREYGTAERPTTAAERKLTRNKQRLATDFGPGAPGAAGAFELVAAGPRKPFAPTLTEKPARPGAVDDEPQVRLDFGGGWGWGFISSLCRSLFLSFRWPPLPLGNSF